jgi:hypothetical protein
VCDVFDDGTAARDPRSARLLDAARIVVGLHPDQATEAIVAFALARGLAFAVAPCCVFADLFAERRLRDGTPVRTYDQFCQYLVDLAADSGAAVEIDHMCVAGRNKVIFSRGPVKP